MVVVQESFVNGLYLRPQVINCGYLFICASKVLLLDLGRFFSFLILYAVGRTP
jgi:hypothetical protein